MLLELHIAGLGVIEDVSLELAPGLSVLTGETGAGKTMVTVALGLALGARASSGLVREGAPAARVQARFRAPDVGEVVEWAEDGELILARQIGADGRGTARVGGHIVPVSTLAALAPLLVEVHGQNEHQRLLSLIAQTAFLDRFAGADHRDELERYRRAYRGLRETRERLEDLERAAREREREKDLLAYQIREIEAAGVVPGELDALREEEGRLGNAERLSTLASQAEDALGGDRGAADALAEAAAAMARAAQVDAGAGTLAKRLESVAADAADAALEVRRYGESVEADPARLAEVHERVAAVRALERKYGEGEAAILAFLEEARTKLASLQGAEEETERLAEEARRLGEEAEARAARVRSGRASAAQALAGALEVELWDLGMEGASVEVRLADVDLGPDGTERVELMLSAGSGQPLLPLRRSASGGELSRAMLACRSVLADLDEVPTLVFDEVDAGIGGRAGVSVGRRLARVARSRQVLVVTHLPQIAAFADRHFRVEKSGGRTTVQALDEGARVAELSRMLAGLPTSQAASSHAEELLAEAAREKSG